MLKERIMVRVVAKNFIKPENIEAAKPLFKKLIAATRKEAGCIEYRLFSKPEEPGLFVFIEEWKTQAALDKHMASEHFTTIIPQIDKLKAKKGDALVLSQELK
jgi:quinol monooxygenase YgiN